MSIYIYIYIYIIAVGAAQRDGAGVALRVDVAALRLVLAVQDPVRGAHGVGARVEGDL